MNCKIKELMTLELLGWMGRVWYYRAYPLIPKSFKYHNSRKNPNFISIGKGCTGSGMDQKRAAKAFTWNCGKGYSGGWVRGGETSNERSQSRSPLRIFFSRAEYLLSQEINEQTARVLPLPLTRPQSSLTRGRVSFSSFPSLLARLSYFPRFVSIPRALLLRLA